jgi:hypothetical protein
MTNSPLVVIGDIVAHPGFKPFHIKLSNGCDIVVDMDYMCLQYQMIIHQSNHRHGSVITVGNKVIHAVTLARR